MNEPNIPEINEEMKKEMKAQNNEKQSGRFAKYKPHFDGKTKSGLLMALGAAGLFGAGTVTGSAIANHTRSHVEAQIGNYSAGFGNSYGGNYGISQDDLGGLENYFSNPDSYYSQGEGNGNYQYYYMDENGNIVQDPNSGSGKSNRESGKPEGKSKGQSREDTRSSSTQDPGQV